MHSEEDDKLMRIFINERESYQHRPLFEAIITKANELGIATATAYRGLMGYGLDRRLKTSAILELSANLPVIVELIDIPEKLEKIIPFLDVAVSEGFVTIESVHVFKYKK